MTSLTIQQSLDLATQHHRAGRLQQAEAIYRQILAAQPENAEALHRLGVLAGQGGRLDIAVGLIRQAIAAAPDNPEYHVNLGKFLRNQGQLDQAIACYQRAVEIMPDYPAAYNNLGNAWMDKGRLDEAIICYQRAAQIKPNSHEPHNNLGMAWKEKGQIDQAIACFQRAVQIKPDSAESHYNLGNAWTDKGQADEAIASYQRALALKPEFFQAHGNLGQAWMHKGQLDQAIVCFQRALEIKPDCSGTHNELGHALLKKGQPDQAILCFQRALALKPEYLEARNNLGNAYRDIGQLDEAIACYRQALELDPQSASAGDNLLLALHYHPGFDARSLRAEGMRWNRQQAEPLRRFIQPLPNNRDPDRRLRIGYVSPDFRNHPVGRFILPLLASHDHKAFEVFCYAEVPAPDEMTAKFQAHADAWRNTVGLSDEKVAEMIRQDRIDILVDLALHTSGNRLLVLARKPAPVQATFAGYPGSTGLETIDYRLTDPYLDPPDQDDSCYSEKTVRLPDTFWCNGFLSAEPPINPLPADSNGYVTFGCLNNFCKVNDRVLSLWASVLNANAGSHLLLLAPEGSARQRVLDRLDTDGIAVERIQFVGLQPRSKYLQTYHRIDIGLDTLPYNGHATSFDSFWMGVPVITLVGQTVVGRAGLSQLTNLGLPELIAHTPEQYVRIATELAHDPSHLHTLQTLRTTLRDRMAKSPLMDAAAFARGVESAFTEMWRTWCAQNPAGGA